jgi:HlyD family secretion protein
MPGALDRIAPQAVIKNGIKGFSARILIKSIDPRVRPGMTAILNIPVSSADNVLAVPLAAVFTENNERYVFVKNDEKFERRNIIIGITDYSFAEVREGLTAGEVVSLEQTVTGTTNKPPGAGATTGAGGARKISGGGGSGITGGPSGGSRPGGSGSPGGARPRSTGS